MPVLGYEWLEQWTHLAAGLRIEESQQNSGGFELWRDHIFGFIEQVLWRMSSQI